MATCARELNARYLAAFAPLYASLIRATGGNGEDLSYAFHAISTGGKVFPHGRCQTGVCGLQTGQYAQLDKGAHAAVALHKRPAHLAVSDATAT